jgi:hypothetical protein
MAAHRRRCGRRPHRRFSIVDRREDMIITAGFNVYPAEVERVIATHPAVARVAVDSENDEIKGELARAYVVLRPGAAATEADIVDHCRPHLAAYKLPRSVRSSTICPRPPPARSCAGSCVSSIDAGAPGASTQRRHRGRAIRRRFPMVNASAPVLRQEASVGV